MVPKYESYKVSNTIISFAFDDRISVTPLKMQKLIYLAYGHMIAHENTRLTNEYFEAWVYGPVIRPLYNILKQFEGKPIDNYYFPEEKSKPWFMEDNKIKDKKDSGFLRFVYDAYKGFTAGQLVEITHLPGGAWHRTIKDHGVNAQIDDKLIEGEFANKPLKIRL